jgi:hypothetical protein
MYVLWKINYYSPLSGIISHIWSMLVKMAAFIFTTLKIMMLGTKQTENLTGDY